jgi:tartrate dehydratase alpha subunit/fumarate hydratase class I-like protein
MPTKRKTVNLTIDLELLCEIWDSRQDETQDLDSRLEDLLLKGLEATNRIAYNIPNHLLRKLWYTRADKKQTLDERLTELIQIGMKQPEQQKQPKCPDCGSYLICPECDTAEEDEEHYD